MADAVELDLPDCVSPHESTQAPGGEETFYSCLSVPASALDRVGRCVKLPFVQLALVLNALTQLEESVSRLAIPLRFRDQAASEVAEQRSDVGDIIRILMHEIMLHGGELL